MINSFEQRILKKVAESQLITKAELGQFLKNNGLAAKDISDINRMLDSASNNLMEKNLMSAISPVGSTCYIITQKGVRFLSNL